MFGGFDPLAEAGPDVLCGLCDIDGGGEWAASTSRDECGGTEFAWLPPPFALSTFCASGGSDPLESEDAGDAARRPSACASRAESVGTSAHMSFRGELAGTGTSGGGTDGSACGRFFRFAAVFARTASSRIFSWYCRSE